MKSENKVMKCVILAGGKGTRLRPYTHLVPKPLLPYKQKPILEHIIEYLKSYGITDIVLSIGYLGYQIRNYFGDGSAFGVNIQYIEEKEPLGTAGCLNMIRDSIKGTFLLFGGDNITSLKLDKFMQYHKDKKSVLTVALFNCVTKIPWGVYNLNSDGSVKDFIEKPQYSHNAGTMIFCLEPEVLKHVPKNIDRPYNLTDDIIPQLLAEKKKIYGYRFDEQWIDIGNIEDYRKLAEQ